MKNIKNFFTLNLLVTLCSALISSCSNDDEQGNVIMNQVGTVLGTVSCNTSDGLAYSISVDNLELEQSDFIITASLPEEFHNEGTEIMFDMEPLDEGITFCTANFFPEQFHKITNVTLTNENP